VFGCIEIADVNRGSHVIDQDDSRVGERRSGYFLSRQSTQLVVELCGNSRCELGGRRQQNDLGIDAVLGLREQVRRHKFGRRISISDDKYFRWARGHVNRSAFRIGANQGFGAGDPGIARPEDLAHLWDRFSAVGHSGDGLGTAYFVYFVHAGARGCNQYSRVGGTVRPRRRAQNSGRTACDLGWNGQHDGRRG